MSEYDAALLAWLRYHVETETYDRSISSTRDLRSGDAVIGHDPWIRGQSYAFAREARKRHLDNMGCVNSSDWRDAKAAVCSWSYETQLLQLAALERDLTPVATDSPCRTGARTRP